MNEYDASIFSNLYGVETVCLRYFNVYSPRQDPASDYAAVIPKFISRLMEGQVPVIYGDGEQTRDFVFVKDVGPGEYHGDEERCHRGVQYGGWQGDQRE